MNQLTVLSQAIQHSRRTFLLRGAGALAFPLTLAACGGSDGGDTAPPTTDPGTSTTPSLVPLTTSKAKGTITLPAGASVTIASVVNAFGASTPATDGTFDFVSAAESEMFAVGVGPGGKMVLSGLLQAGAAVLSARSTALCLGYTALGVGAYLPVTQEQYLAAMQAAPELTALENAVAAAIVARGEGWLDLTDPALASAISALQAALSPAVLAGTASPAGSTQRDSTAQDASTGRARAQGMVIDKTDRVSGLQVTGDGVATITLTNYYRRRSYAYVDRVSYKASYDGDATDSPATVGDQPTKIDATKSITNTLVTLAQLFGGVKDFYDPVVYAGIATPIAPTTAALTTYRVTSVGLGVSLGDLSSLTADQRTGLRNVCAETVVLDVVVPIFCGILIPIKTAGMKTFIDTFALSRLKDVIGALAASDDVLLNKIVAANEPLSTVLWDALLMLVNSDTLKNAILGFFQDIIDNLSAAGSLPATNVVNVGAQAFLDALSAIDLTAQTMDLVATGLSFAASDLADRFSIDVTKSQVRLNPQNPQIDAAQVTNFTLSVIDSDLAAGDLSYRWQCGCVFGDVSDGTHTNATSGTAFDSASTNLAYDPRGQGKGGDQDVVTGIVYKGSVLATRVQVGTATSTVTYNAAITPANLQMPVATQQTFTAAMSTALLASGATLQYTWTVSGGGTVNGATTTTTSTPSVSYAAASTAGAATLSLKVTNAGGAAVTQGSVAITVVGAVAVGIVPQNPQVPQASLQLFTVNPSGSSFPDGTTFKWVLTHTPDLFGGAEDLGGSGGGTIGVNPTIPPSSGAPTGTSVTVVTSTPHITLAANPFGPESGGSTFVWLPNLVLTVTIINAGGAAVATSSVTIDTQIPTTILLP